MDGSGAGPKAGAEAALGVEVLGSGVVQGLGFGVKGLGFRGFGVQGPGFKVQGVALILAVRV